MAFPSYWISTLTELAHVVMGKLGEKHVFTDVESDTSDYALVFQRLMYEAIREAQVEFKWSELETIATIATADSTYDSSTSPIPYSYRFALPDGMLRMIDENICDYHISGAYIYVNAYSENLPFIYTAYSEDPTVWGSMLTKVIVYKIAMAVCLPVTNSSAYEKGLIQEFETLVEPKCHRINSYNKVRPRRQQRGTGSLAQTRRGYKNGAYYK